MMIAIHTHPDLDVATCVALAGVKDIQTEVLFWNSALREIPPGCEDARILDHPLGEKGRLDPDGTRHAAALSMPEAEPYLGGDLLAEVDEHDSTGRVLHPRFSLGAVCAGLRREASERLCRSVPPGDHRVTLLDRETLEVQVKVVRGLMLLEQDRRQAEATADQLPLVEVKPGVKIAIRPKDEPYTPMVGIVLAERGIAGCVYADGHNLGVTRYPGYEDVLDLRVLEPFLAGKTGASGRDYFVHSAGFLVAWGSIKAPAEGPPPLGTPQNQEELLDLLAEALRA